VSQDEEAVAMNQSLPLTRKRSMAVNHNLQIIMLFSNIGGPSRAPRNSLIKLWNPVSCSILPGAAEGDEEHGMIGELRSRRRLGGSENVMTVKTYRIWTWICTDGPSKPNYLNSDGLTLFGCALMTEAEDHVSGMI
jgi:hypothetical protein